MLLSVPQTQLSPLLGCQFSRPSSPPDWVPELWQQDLHLTARNATIDCIGGSLCCLQCGETGAGERSYLHASEANSSQHDCGSAAVRNGCGCRCYLHANEAKSIKTRVCLTCCTASGKLSGSTSSSLQPQVRHHTSFSTRASAQRNTSYSIPCMCRLTVAPVPPHSAAPQCCHQHQTATAPAAAGLCRCCERLRNCCCW